MSRRANTITESERRLSVQEDTIKAKGYVVPADSVEAAPLYSAIRTNVYLRHGRPVHPSDVSASWERIDGAGRTYDETALSGATRIANSSQLDMSLVSKRKSIMDGMWYDIVALIRAGKEKRARDTMQYHGVKNQTASTYVYNIKRFCGNGIYQRMNGKVSRPPVGLLEAVCREK